MHRFAAVGLCLVAGCQSDVCAELEDRSFESVEVLPCGAVNCAWAIDFRSGRFSWKHDTVVDVGSYACDAESISATRDADGAGFAGSYDEASDTLTWDGKRYRSIR